MNIALIIAGGSGQRMNQEIPKQFINVFDKPLIIYTMEAFQSHPDIDGIMVVCLKGWEDILRAYARQFRITKLIGVVKGGETGQASIYNGLVAIKEKYDDDTVVLVNGAVRPLLTDKIITDNLATYHLYGSAITAIPCPESIFQTEDRKSSDFFYDRDKLVSTQAPHAFSLGKLIWAHEQAKEKGITNSINSCTLMAELGERIYFSAGSPKNIKLTTAEDIEIFKAFLDCEEK